LQIATTNVEKIFLKPTQTEILIKGSPKEGHFDIFSYDYHADESKRSLGNLYVVGNIQRSFDTHKDSSSKDNTEESDVAYATNLVASLAKREYYSNPDLSPKEAFSATLRKINDVVDEFFINKDAKINIGIFALTGENINISKLGKFKILLARDNKTIDILNNIDLFTKEKVEEKEFSHIVSGRIAHGDKVLAFCPSRLAAIKEKAIKENFLKLNAKQFLEKIGEIKGEKVDFTYAALYINLDKVKEPAVIPKAAKVIPSPITVSEIDEKKPPKEGDKQSEYIIPEPELPRIIRSEFALGKKNNPFITVLGKIKMFLPKRQNKVVFFTSLGILILIGAWTAKTFFFVSPEQKQTSSAINEAQNNIKLAKTKINQNDFLSARKLLLGSIASINLAVSSKKTDDAKSEIVKLLDNLDQAVESSPILTETLPKSVSDKAALLASEKTRTGATGLDIYEDNLYFIGADGISKISDISNKPKDAVQWLKSEALLPESLLIAVDGKVYVLNKSGLLATYYKGKKENETNTLVFPDDSSLLATTKNSQYLYLINKNMGRIYLLSKANGTLFKTLKVSSQEAFTNAYLDQDEAVYLVGKDGKIWKVMPYSI